MDIGVVGSGNIGANAARLFAGAGHRVAVSNSRGPETLSGLVGEIGANARAATVGEAARSSEVVLLAVPFYAREALPADSLSGKIVVDATNYYPGRDGRIEMGDLVSSELLARSLPGARVVKAFNTIYYERLWENGRKDAPVEEREVIFVAGDDGEAKRIVSRLIEEIGFAPVDTGSLHEGGRRQQPNSPIYNVAMTPDRAREMLTEPA